ncbi:MAG: type II secretion system protein J [Limisphaerales bacterium]
MRALSPTPVRDRAAFTVIELLLAVAIMTLIVFGLYAVFDQTQKALRGSIQQVDVFEGARAAVDLLREDVEQVAVGGQPHRANLYSGIMSNLPPVPVADLSGGPLMTLSAGELYLLHRANNGWRGVGWWLDFDTNTVAGVRVGTLMRYTSTGTNVNLPAKRFGSRPPDDDWRVWKHALPADRYFALQPDNQGLNVLNLHNSRYPLVWPDRTNLAFSAPVLGNVVHFRITAYDDAGVAITEQTIPPRGREDVRTPYRDLPRREFLEQFEVSHTRYGEMSYRFTGGVLPAYVEVELGLVEPQVAERLRGFTTPEGAGRYLSQNAGRIHLFRQRIPLANAPKS